VLTLLDAVLAPLGTDTNVGAIAGDEALAVIEDAIRSLPIGAGRFGDPAVFVGTVRGAAGLRFRAVRVIGLAEGSLPTVPREDAVLPDTVRRALTPALATTPGRVLAQLHALDRVIRDTTDEVVLSMPRRTLDGSEREPSVVFLEALAALGRPDPGSSARAPTFADSLGLRRRGFLPARVEARRFRRESGASQAASLDRAAETPGPVPRQWLSLPELDVRRIRALLDGGAPGPMDGLLGATGAANAANTGPMLSGLAPGRPISASRLKTLLGCPHQHLYENVLGWDEPDEVEVASEIDPMMFGTLFHDVAEAFHRAHGTAFGKRERSLAAWKDIARTFADEVFDSCARSYPLAGDEIRDQQRQRLQRAVRTLLDRDWDGKPRRFVDVERSFGEPEGIELATPSGPLWVRGQIDRIDVEGGVTLVRDLKTGRPDPRDPGDAPDATTDIQIALYGLAIKAESGKAEPGKAKLPEVVHAAYAYFNARGTGVRAYTDDFPVLEAAAWQWLALARDLLAARAFPRTPDPEDCTFCRFKPVCGPAAHDRASDVLATADGVLARFRALKTKTTAKAKDKAKANPKKKQGKS
jgi:hypothetical protein